MRTTTVAAMIVLLFGCAAVAVFGGEREDLAVTAAEHWLDLVDGGAYDQSWKEAASLFRGVVKEADWVASLNAIRKPLGKAISRNLKGAQFTTELPGVPDGEYVVIQFETSFENKASAVETITPMKDDDGTWRVSGYFIR